VVGAVYMLTAYKKHSGQYFTPWNIAEMMARMTIRDGAQEITDRLRQAQRIATERCKRSGDANSHLLSATILAGLAVPDEQTKNYFLNCILPLIAADFDPITICDPCCGSGVMLLAAARQFPAWAAQAGLVQLYGMDIDQMCVTMAQVNMMLYGLNGTSVHPALTATTHQLARLPEPFEQAYSLAQEAQAAGDTDLVEEIADTLRVQQALFDVNEFTHRVKAQPRAAIQRPQPQTDTSEQFTIPW
jgi:2-polyprenyl-3-methyl-5-hydroxy-6-metoxy-1,4-benzoquinol methylase